MIFALIFCVSAEKSDGQALTALSRVIDEDSRISDMIFGDVMVELSLSQPVPFKLNAAKDPNRVFVDFNGLQWTSKNAQAIEDSDKIEQVQFGLVRPGWTRLVLELRRPLEIVSAEMAINQSDGSAEFRMRLGNAEQSEFEAQIVAETNDDPALSTFSEPRQSGPLRVVLDPGHGGVDPGAVVNKDLEKDLMLQFARELQEYLIKTGNYDVSLTRNEDTFVSLVGRIGRAREDQADVFISLHADALLEGIATGITIYTLSEKASDEAAAQLASEMDRTDLLMGLDLTYQDDEIASVLYDLARRDTEARSVALAEQMVEKIGDALFQSRMRPRLSAAFTVLKAPDVPSILIELGFITNPRDLANLKNPNWRQKVIEGIEIGLRNWEVEDAARAKLLRK